MKYIIAVHTKRYRLYVRTRKRLHGTNYDMYGHVDGQSCNVSHLDVSGSAIPLALPYSTFHYSQVELRHVRLIAVGISSVIT